MTRLAEFVIRRRRWILIGALLVFLVSGALGGNVASKLSSGGFDDPKAESSQADDILQDTFGAGQPNFLLLVTAKNGTVDDPAVQAAGIDLTNRLTAEGSIDQAVSYWTLGAAPPLRSEDGKKALILAVIKGEQDEVLDEAKRLEPKYAVDTEVVDVRAGGFAQIFVEVQHTIERDLTRAESVAFPITLLVLIVVFGSVVAASLPLAVGVLAIVGTFLVLRLLSGVTEVSVFSINMTTALGLGLAIDYSLFVVSRFREETRRGLDKHAAIVRTMQTAGRTVVFGGLTVAIALSALLVFPLTFLKSFAYAGVGVVAFAVGGAVLVLPALLYVLGPRVDSWSLRRHRNVTDDEGFWHRAAVFVMRRPIPIATSVILVLLLLGSPFLDATFGLPDDRVLPDHAPVRQVHQEIRDDFESDEAGAISVVASTIGSPLDRVGEIEAYAISLSQVPGVSRVDSLAGSYVRGQQVVPPNPLFEQRFARPEGTWMSAVPSVEPVSTAGEDVVKALREVPRTPPG